MNELGRPELQEVDCNGKIGYQAGYAPPPGHDPCKLKTPTGRRRPPVLRPSREALLELQELTGAFVATVRGIASRRRGRSSRTRSRRRTRSPTRRCGRRREAARRARRPALPGLLSALLLLEEAGAGDLEQAARQVHAKLVAPAPARLRRRRGRRPPGACARTGSGSRPSRRGARASSTTSPESLPALLLGAQGAAPRARRRLRVPRRGRRARRSRDGAARAESRAPTGSRRPRRSRTRGTSRSSATCSSRPSTSRGGSTSIPSWRCDATTARFRTRVERAEELAAEDGEAWRRARRSRSRTAYFDRAKEALR